MVHVNMSIFFLNKFLSQKKAAATRDIHFKDIIKLELYRLIKGESFCGFEENFGIPHSTTNNILPWARHKSEFFHTSYLTSLSLQERLRIMVQANKKPYTF